MRIYYLNVFKFIKRESHKIILIHCLFVCLFVCLFCSVGISIQTRNSLGRSRNQWRQNQRRQVDCQSELYHSDCAHGGVSTAAGIWSQAIVGVNISGSEWCRPTGHGRIASRHSPVFAEWRQDRRLAPQGVCPSITLQRDSSY